MRNTRQMSKMQMQSAMSQANPEVVQIPEEEKPPQEPAGGEGAGALVVAPVNGAAAAAAAEITVHIAKAKLHCPLCTLPLKPPIFECKKFGHLACGVCRFQLPADGRCYACGGHAGDDGGYYTRSPAMEDMVRSARVPCPHGAYGCRGFVPYYAVEEHQRSCPHAPCLCSEPGCGFAGSPATLRDHMAGAAHAWPVDGVRYGAALHLRVPESDPGQHRRVLAVADGGGGEGGDADGAVFFLAVGTLGENPLRVVSLVCARPKAAAAESPQYACTITVADAAAAAGKGAAAESVVLTKAPVPSSKAPGKTSMEEAASLVVLRRSLPGTAAEDMDITVRIDKIG